MEKRSQKESCQNVGKELQVTSGVGERND